ncbi:hypothetical protein BDZ89DRAFT_1167675 [Hymenopellis radicata]|nr:hypothetical protein BDZ89DRAFT_1167675 [Hymenopellis radicata]
MSIRGQARFGLGTQPIVFKFLSADKILHLKFSPMSWSRPCFKNRRSSSPDAVSSNRVCTTLPASPADQRGLISKAVGEQTRLRCRLNVIPRLATRLGLLWDVVFATRPFPIWLRAGWVLWIQDNNGLPPSIGIPRSKRASSSHPTKDTANHAAMVLVSRCLRRFVCIASIFGRNTTRSSHTAHHPSLQWRHIILASHIAYTFVFVHQTPP